MSLGVFSCILLSNTLVSGLEMEFGIIQPEFDFGLKTDQKRLGFTRKVLPRGEKRALLSCTAFLTSLLSFQIFP